MAFGFNSGWSSLLLKEFKAPTVSCRGREELSMIDVSLAHIQTEPACLLSLILSLSELPQQTTVEIQLLPPWAVFNSVVHTLKDLSILSRQIRIWPFMYKTSVLCPDQLCVEGNMYLYFSMMGMSKSWMFTGAV